MSNLTGLATDPLHRIVYESDTGNLFFDADGSGSGGRIRFAILDQNLALLAGDFLVI